MVFASACISSNSRVMAWAVVRSRLPVGSSAKQQRRLADQRPGDGDALAFAAGEFGRPVVEPLGEADAFEQLPGVFFVDVGGDAVGQERDQHVFQHRALRQQVVLLKHEADLPAAELGECRLVQLEGILAQQT